MIYFQNDTLLIRDLVPADAAIITQEEIAQGWHQTIDKYNMRLMHQAQGKAVALAAVYNGQVAGYVNVYPHAAWGPFARWQYPQIIDLGVLEKYRQKGIAGHLMNCAEHIAAQYADTVCLGVGLHSGYGAAQRLYIRRGYVPDGSGVWYKGTVCPPYTACCNDDELILYMVKQLR